MIGLLRLVVDNRTKVNNDKLITCRNSCELFDDITNSCSIKQNVKVDSPHEAMRCGHFIPRLSQKSGDFRFKLIGYEEDFIVDDDDIFHELIGQSFNEETSTYPLQPDFPSKNPNAVWYVSPDQKYGCWIVNEYKKPLEIPTSIETAVKGWANKVYKSPVPLHNHKTSLSLASKIAWYIDKDGYGQYVLLVNGKISTLSFPKPPNWRG